MSRIERINFIIPYNVYEDLKSYLRKKSSYFRTYEQVSNGFKLTIQKDDSTSGSWEKYNKVSVEVNSLLSDFIGFNTVADRVSKIMLIFKIPTSTTEYYINIDKKTDDTKKSAISKFNTVKWNNDNTEFVENQIYYSNFGNERELMLSCYLLLSNSDLLTMNKDIWEYVTTKLNYFGYDEEDYSLSHIKRLSNSSDMVNCLASKINKMFANNLENEDNIISDMDADDLVDIYLHYLDLLEIEGKFKD